jgi:hypothetical protein
LSASGNKDHLQRICAAPATGDAAPLRAAMADFGDTRLLETALSPPVRS